MIEDAEKVDQETGEVSIVPVAPELPNLALQRVPEEVLAEAKQAATALQKVINSKPKPVRFRGEIYLELPRAAAPRPVRHLPPWCETCRS